MPLSRFRRRMKRPLRDGPTLATKILRAALHFLELVLASAAVTAFVIYTPLVWSWWFVLIHVFHIPIPIQTGADWHPHPIYDHPLFVPLTIFLPVLAILAGASLSF